jgi:hypothetical protein
MSTEPSQAVIEFLKFLTATTENDPQNAKQRIEIFLFNRWKMFERARENNIDLSYLENAMLSIGIARLNHRFIGYDLKKKMEWTDTRLNISSTIVRARYGDGSPTRYKPPEGSSKLLDVHLEADFVCSAGDEPSANIYLDTPQDPNGPTDCTIVYSISSIPGQTNKIRRYDDIVVLGPELPVEIDWWHAHRPKPEWPPELPPVPRQVLLSGFVNSAVGNMMLEFSDYNREGDVDTIPISEGG